MEEDEIHLNTLRIKARRDFIERNWNEESKRVVAQVGKFWETVRLSRNLNLPEVAEALSISEETLALFELGLVSHSDLPRGFMVKLAVFLKASSELSEHIRLYETEYLRAFFKEEL